MTTSPSRLLVRFDGNKEGTDENGVRRQHKGTTNVVDWTISSSYLKSTHDFKMTLIDDDPLNLRDLECQPVTLYVNGAPQLIGRIDLTTRGNRGSSVECTGRDYRSDIVECNIDPTFVVKEGETLGQVILRATSPVGITRLGEGSDVATARNVRTGVSVGGPAAPPNFINIKQDDFKPDPGQGIYEFLKKICERHGCTIQPASDRYTLLIAGPMYKSDVAYSIIRTRNQTTANNVDTATATRDYSSFPTMVMVQGHGSPRHGEATKSNQAILDTWSEAQHYGGELGRTLNTVTWSGRRKPGEKDGDIVAQHKIYRLNYFRDNQARNATQLNKAAQRLLAEHLKNTLVYEVTLNGHIDPESGAIWSIDTMVWVEDEVCDIHEKLWVVDRTLSFGQGGAKTTLKCIRPGSFDI